VVPNSTATCPKTMKYRNGFIRIVTAASPLRQAAWDEFLGC
jgi:hypothetical protein